MTMRPKCIPCPPGAADRQASSIRDSTNPARKVLPKPRGPERQMVSIDGSAMARINRRWNGNNSGQAVIKGSFYKVWGERRLAAPGQRFDGFPSGP